MRVAKPGARAGRLGSMALRRLVTRIASLGALAYAIIGVVALALIVIWVLAWGTQAHG
jgi:hypothetical protein